MIQKIYLCFLFLGSLSLVAQHAPAKKQSQSILILNGTAHIGNGKVINSSAIGFKDGKLDLVTESNSDQLVKSNYDQIIDASGKHVYPGFIAANSTLGLVEIDAVKSSDDESELGDFNPNVKSIVAYNAESRVIETVRPNGVLMAQITPRGGRFSGSSSVVQLDSWNWQDAIIKENDGLHLNFPSSFKRSGWWAEPGEVTLNKEYAKQVSDISNLLSNSKSYFAENSKVRNLIFESMQGLFDGSKTLFIHADDELQIVDGIKVAQKNGVKKIVIVGGFEAYKVAKLLESNAIPVLLRRVHQMPIHDDQDVNLPYKMAKILVNMGVLVGLENSGDMERMNTRNLPFLAGTCAAYGLDKEQALALITLNTAKILGIDVFCGSLETGKDATLFVSDGDALDMRTNKLTHAFIQGRKISLENHQTQLNKIYTEKYEQQ
ncbi:amidohydrolase family protein [Flavobacterium sp. TAB 87]|uniref:amidohydrolase family protein n=1 Tax=Flavobacterium sp. TAB 87 TaxID=1729581 RepID=UPI00076CCDB1|nr:amidohydrolase family protein [Flavobacterium sp. TAB 87]KVV14882.1 imidazolonepropionase [Flavobacterium sp. TAB 87]